jgi:GGDEF domain-containing protein
MISIFKALGTREKEEKDDLQSVLLRVVMLVLETAALHAVDYDRETLVEFQRSIRSIRREMEQTTEPPHVLVLAGSAIKLIETHNRGAEKAIGQHRAEMRAIITMMSSALLRVSSTSDLTSRNLRQIGKELQEVSQLESIPAIKGKMAISLKCLGEEAERQEHVSIAIKEEIASRAKEEAALMDLDPETGLPGLKQAEQHVAAIADGVRKVYVIVMHLERLEMINGRFGFDEGNKILCCFGQRVAQRLSTGDYLFRWRGPCFVAVIERPYGPDIVRTEASKIASALIEHTVEVGSRSVLLTLSSAWMLLPMLKTTDVAELRKKVDAFTSEQQRLSNSGK